MWKSLSRSVSITMEPGALVVLIDGEPTDAALVGKAREYADAKGCPVTLVRVLPEVTTARADNGVGILPWQIMQLMGGNAKFELERLRLPFLRGREQPNTTPRTLGLGVEEIAALGHH